MNAATSDRTYHHGDLRQTLMAAAVRHITAKGTEGLSLRAIAREAGVSATAPYRHFESRTALLAALAEEGFDELSASMPSDEARLAEDPLGVLLDAGLAYVGYAAANPVKYQLMFGGAIGDFSPYAGLLSAADRAYGRFQAVLQGGLDAGQLAPIELRELGGTVWAMVHGLAGMMISVREKAETLREIQELAREPLEAQAAVAGAPERALARLMGGVVVDRRAYEALLARVGLG